MPTFRTSLAIAGPVAVLTLACGGDRPSPVEPDVRVASVAVSPSADTLTSLGQTRRYTATARDAAGNVISGKTFTW